MREPSDNIISNAEKALRDEVFAATIYTRLAKIYRDRTLKSKLLKFAEMEKRHVSFWRNFLERRGYKTSHFLKVKRVKVFIYTGIFRLLGLGLTLRMLELGETEAIKFYSNLLEGSELSGEEREALRRILEDEFVHEREFSYEESKFEEFLDHIRDAILGMNDGLVEILSVTSGLAGVYGIPFFVAVGGLIVGLAGALSMAIGSFVSVRAQRQVHEGTLRNINIASHYVPYLFKDRIVELMKTKGFSNDTSKQIAEEAIRDTRLLSKIISEEEYGLKEEKLENPIMSGLYTGLFYLFGSLFPLTPYFLNLPINISLLLSLVFAALALSFAGFIIAISAGTSIRGKVAEIVLSGLGAAGITYIIGRVASIIFGIEVA